ncbi:aryl-sulfate sulfotransferase [Lentisphaerota bacterium WC36G]|nr:aryl-sulfate sulfotransferase [Lentisphaerae bacterium WC36]
MKKLLLATLVLSSFVGVMNLVAEEKKDNKQIQVKPKQKVKNIYGDFDGYILATGKGATVLIDKNGKIVWSFKAGNNHDVWMLDNGNVLFADGSVKEVNPKTNKVVWRYTPKYTKGGGAFACQRLKNGNTVVGENGTGKVTEVDPKGNVVMSFGVKPYKKGSHHNMRMVRKTADGTYLVAMTKNKIYREYDAKGNVLWEKKVDGPLAFSIVKLPNGNYLTGQVTGIVEYDKKGKVVWSYDPKKDTPEVKVGMICGINAMPNGNVAFGIYKIVQDQKNGAALMEITRDKKVVWRYIDTKYRPGAMMSLEVLDNKKKPVSKLR